MQLSNRSKFLVESGLGALCAALALLTVVWPDWIEDLTGLDPDRHDGSAEWGLVAGFATVALVCAGLARLEWRKLRAA